MCLQVGFLNEMRNEVGGASKAYLQVRMLTVYTMYFRGLQIFSVEVVTNPLVATHTTSQLTPYKKNKRSAGGNPGNEFDGEHFLLLQHSGLVDDVIN